MPGPYATRVPGFSSCPDQRDEANAREETSSEQQAIRFLDCNLAPCQLCANPTIQCSVCVCFRKTRAAAIQSSIALNCDGPQIALPRTSEHAKSGRCRASRPVSRAAHEERRPHEARHETGTLVPKVWPDRAHTRGVAMIGYWWWFWLAFIFLFLLPPLGYGWGYRGWGPPYPTYFQRRRLPQSTTQNRPDARHLSWGWFGDFVWLIAIIGTVWAFAALFWGWGRW